MYTLEHSTSLKHDFYLASTEYEIIIIFQNSEFNCLGRDFDRFSEKRLNVFSVNQ